MLFGNLTAIRRIWGIATNARLHVFALLHSIQNPVLQNCDDTKELEMVVRVNHNNGDTFTTKAHFLPTFWENTVANQMDQHLSLPAAFIAIKLDHIPSLNAARNVAEEMQIQSFQNNLLSAQTREQLRKRIEFRVI